MLGIPSSERSRHGSRLRHIVSEVALLMRQSDQTGISPNRRPDRKLMVKLTYSMDF